MGTIAVTGAAGGIGRATCTRLEADGHRVIGVDVRDADVIADLRDAAGRAAMLDGVARACEGGLHGVIAGAGVMGDDPDVVSINYFGAIATLDGLRPLIAQSGGGAAIAISSNSTTTQPGLPNALVDVILSGDEEAARDAVPRNRGNAYAASKLALARWVRHHAVTSDWIGAGVQLNAIAPGLIHTPMTVNDVDWIMNLGDVFPVPIGRPGKPDEIASLLAYLCSPDATFFCGSVIFVDGGTDAATRADDWPAPRA
ncbi:MAG: Bacilysin biosynthesis oxidoreductase BacC [Actinomycetia bacterium]|nr:Bacilysin biosynthesis oxidoreductase BacC [Actinomycetes bacterium]